MRAALIHPDPKLSKTVSFMAS